MCTQSLLSLMSSCSREGDTTLSAATWRTRKPGLYTLGLLLALWLGLGGQALAAAGDGEEPEAPSAASKARHEAALKQALARWNPLSDWADFNQLQGTSRWVTVRRMGRALAKQDVAGSLPIVADLFPGSDQKFFLEGLVGGWAEFDPVAAARYLTEQLADRWNPRNVQALFTTWARSDPGAAADYLSTLDPVTPRGLALQTVIGEWAKDHPSEAIKWAERLPALEECDALQVNGMGGHFTLLGTRYCRSHALQVAAFEWLKSNPGAALDWAESLPSGRIRASVLQVLSVFPRPSVMPKVTKSMDVTMLGLKIGVLTVSDYDAEIDMPNGLLKLRIRANFKKTGIEDGAEELLKKWFPNGLTFMQVHEFTFDSKKQQQIFRDMKKDDLKGTFSDPPQEGYTLRSGNTSLKADKTPWYSNLKLPMDATNAPVPGGIPPNSFPGDPFCPDNQFCDEPMISFADIDLAGTTFEGLANLLNGMDGMWQFRTALVGVKEIPTDDGDPNTEEALKDPYRVMVLKAFEWGATMKFESDGIGGFTAADYKVTPKNKLLKFTNDVGSKFRGAFDKKDDNKEVEWDVTFVLPYILDGDDVTWGDGKKVKRPIRDFVPSGGGMLKFFWTMGGQPHPDYKPCEETNGTASNKPRRFHQPDDDSITDWSQEITFSDGKSVVVGGNVKQESPWKFHPLSELPDAFWRIPDLAPTSDPDLTIYTAVNLDRYLLNNPGGFLDGVWVPGQSIDELGISITNGQVAGVEGIYWATSDFIFDPDSATGWVPEDGPSAWLDSTEYQSASGPIIILAAHEDDWLFFGTAEGGMIDFLVDGEVIWVQFTAGQSAAEVAAAVAAGINNNSLLSARGIRATAVGNSITLNGSVTPLRLLDGGLTSNVFSASPPEKIPALSAAGAVLLTVLLMVSLAIVLRRRALR